MKTIITWTTVFVVFAALAFAAPPKKNISYQSYLKDGAGNPVSVETNLTFRLYSSTSGVNPGWTESRSITPVNGVYSIGLGETSPLPDPFNRTYYLGVQVGGDPEMRPLQMLMAVPYALQAGCNSGDMLNCYSGSPETMNVGLCKSGVRTCAPDGSNFGACVGAVTPNCSNACLDFSSNVNNCGSCGNSCTNLYPNGSGACNSSNCVLSSCSAGFGNCDGNPNNGCESYLINNAYNCGNCGNVCSYQNAIAACNGGGCSLSTCYSGFGNCDGNTSNGCETYLMNNVNNCGNCGNVCSYQNAYAACNGGGCSLAACFNGYGNCNGWAADGCEINLMNNRNNCGSCGNVCSNPFSPNCNNGSCGS